MIYQRFTVPGVFYVVNVSEVKDPENGSKLVEKALKVNKITYLLVINALYTPLRDDIHRRKTIFPQLKLRKNTCLPLVNIIPLQVYKALLYLLVDK